jgi:hypothetical protein
MALAVRMLVQVARDLAALLGQLSKMRPGHREAGFVFNARPQNVNSVLQDHSAGT